MERIKNYWQEIIAGLISIIVPVLFYMEFKDEAALSVAIGIFLAGFTFQAILIKTNVETTLKSNLELYNLQTSIKDPIFKTEAQKAVDICLRALKSLASGNYEVYGPQPAYEIIEDFYTTAQANDVIKSVVIYDDDIILDRSYLEHHKEAIRRGVIIIKIFIVPDNASTGSLNKIQVFEKIGVKTSLVRRDIIGPDSRLIADFLLYKNIVAISTQDHKEHNGMLSSLKITTQQRDFDDYTRKFDGLSKIASPL